MAEARNAFRTLVKEAPDKLQLRIQQLLDSIVFKDELSASISGVTSTQASAGDGIYVRLATADTITAKHTFAPAAATAPFILGTNAQGQLVTGLNADKLDGQHGSFYQNADNINAGTLVVAYGGTGLNTLAAGRIPYGAGTSPFGSSATFVYTSSSLGVGTAGPDRTLDVLHASDPQVRLTQADGTVYVDLKADSSGNLNILPSGTTVTIGSGAAGVDYILQFNGADSDGVLTWMEDEDYLKLSDDTLVDSTENIYFRDTAISINSADDGHLDIAADTTVDINTPGVVCSGWLSADNFTDSAHYTGFPNRTDTSLSWADGSYTLTLTATNDKIWINGVEYTINTLTKQLSVAQEAVSGLYWFWIALSGATPTLYADTSHPGFDKCLVATVYWNTTTSKGLLSDERHWFGRDQWMHEYLHETVGARYASGLAGTFTDTTFEIGIGEFYDEDIEHDITPAQTTARVLYHNGDADWAWDTLTTPYKVVNPGADSNLRYNSGNNLATVDNNKYVNSWVFISGDTSYPVHIVIGTGQYATIALARAATLPSLGALPSAEEKIIFKVTYQNNGGTPDYIETTDYRSSSNLPTGAYVATDHGSLSGLSDDDHPQYSLVAGTRAFTGNVTIGAAAAGTDYTLTFDGEDNDGVLTWMEDEDRFQFSDDVNLLDGEKLILGTGLDGNIYASSDDLYIEQDTSDKDIIFKVNDGGVDTEVMRIDGSASRVGIGINPPSSRLDVRTSVTDPSDAEFNTISLQSVYHTSDNSKSAYGLYSEVDHYPSNTKNSTGTMWGSYSIVRGLFQPNSNGNLTLAEGYRCFVTSGVSGGTATGTLTNARAIVGVVGAYTGSTIDAAVSFYAAPSSLGGTINSGYGLYLERVYGTTNYGIYQSYSSNPNYFAGNVGIATTAPDRALEINHATGLCARLTYNDANGSAANYAGLDVGSAGKLIITSSGTVKVNIASLPVYANNAAAAAGGLVAGDLYRTNGDPDLVCVVH